MTRISNLPATWADFEKNLLGFDSLFDKFKSFPTETYPPHNIVKHGDNNQDIELAVAGFSPEEIEITMSDNILSISGTKEKTEGVEDKNYVYRGISARSFRRTFEIVGGWKIQDAKFDNGLLIISFEREIPVEQIPKKIEIKKI
jgi:molecular chaperone IbpA